MFNALALWSINERLAGRKGLNLDIPPTQQWFNDSYIVAQKLLKDEYPDALADDPKLEVEWNHQSGEFN